jgi:hypothetical protein
MTNEHGVFSEDRWVYFFGHPDKRELSAGTFDIAGQNLPNLGFIWKPIGALMIGPANRPWVVAMEAALRTDGYYLNSSDGNLLDDKTIKGAVQALVERAEGESD